MRVQIRPLAMELTKAQRIRLEGNLKRALARVSGRIDRVRVEISEGEGEGVTRCRIEVHMKAQILEVDYSDVDLYSTVEHAAQRIARSVSRALEGLLPG